MSQKATVLPNDLQLPHVRMLILWCEMSRNDYGGEFNGYVPWEQAMKQFERKYKALGFAAATDLIHEKFAGSQLLVPPGGKPRAEQFKPSDACMAELEELYARCAKMEKAVGSELTERPKATKPRERVEV